MSDLCIVGLPLRVGVKFVPRLSLRRIYNMKCFRSERYQHEVANHYRDFKLQQTTLPQLQQQQRRQRQQQQQQRRQLRQRRTRSRQRALAPIVNSGGHCRRGELPIHVHYLPRFGDTYTPRGRQAICSSEPTDETCYNDALRRIRSARSCEQLKALVQRQLN